jgi:pyruvate/2-oxoglutarate dehydrogenase complex dihydrolipoamide dehydrogenase (E3) component
MPDSFDYDLCVIGAGSAGYSAAVTARNLGKTVAFMDGPGPQAGLCILRGCMPSKTLLRSAEVAEAVRRAPEAGVIVGEPRIDFGRVMDRKRGIIKGFAEYRVAGIEGFPILRGAAHFLDRETAVVGDRQIRASRFIVATGSVITVPAVQGLEETGYVNSDDVLEFDALPDSVIVLGGGPTACELAQYLVRLGVVTTLIQRSETLLSGEDPDVGIAVRSALERDGITVLTGSKLVKAEKSAHGKIVRIEHGGHPRSVEAREIFAAHGRRANLDDLTLDAAGIDFDRKGIKVDEHLRTTNPIVYAAGDVVYESTQLVHVAVYEGQLAASNAFSATPTAVDYRLQLSRAVFTEPQVAVAGLTERECAARGVYCAVARYPFDDLGKAIATDRTEGFIKVLAASDGTMLGVTIVGAEASDLIHEAIALLHFKANVRDVMMMPHLHPTLAEIITYPAEELLERLENEKRALVTP